LLFLLCLFCCGTTRLIGLTILILAIMYCISYIFVIVLAFYILLDQNPMPLTAEICKVVPCSPHPELDQNEPDNHYKDKNREYKQDDG